MAKYHLKLYVTGKTQRSEKAIQMLKEVCRNKLDLDDYQLDVIDVLDDPQEAEKDRILATPTLIRKKPPPVRRIIGDLADVEKVLLGLDL